MKLKYELEIPKGVQVTLDGDTLKAAGPKGTVCKKLRNPMVKTAVQGGKILFETASEEPKRHDKAMIGTFLSHATNLVKGVSEGFVYRMRIRFVHYPMTAKVVGDKVVVENFLGHKDMKYAKIRGVTKVDIGKTDVTLEGPDLEDVSGTAANIEHVTRVKGFDIRKFQDGIFIYEKAGKSLIG